MNVTVNQYNCSKCSKPFSNKTVLLEHLRNVHKLANKIIVKEKKYVNGLCSICGISFFNKYTLVRHLKQIHKIEGEGAKKGRIKCPLCREYKTSYLELRRHVTEEHGIKINHSEHEFSSLQEFEEWKKNMEQTSSSCYVVNSSPKFMTDGTEIRYFYCHRSHYYNPRGNGARILKENSSNKIGSTCPATLQLVIRKGKFRATLWDTHVGHLQEISSNDTTTKNIVDSTTKISVDSTPKNIVFLVHKSTLDMVPKTAVNLTSENILIPKKTVDLASNNTVFLIHKNNVNLELTSIEKKDQLHQEVKKISNQNETATPNTQTETNTHKEKLNSPSSKSPTGKSEHLDSVERKMRFLKFLLEENDNVSELACQKVARNLEQCINLVIKDIKSCRR